jgi:hypothetical protein
MTMGAGNLLVYATTDAEVEGKGMLACDKVATIAAVVYVTVSIASGTGEPSGLVRSAWSVKHTMYSSLGARVDEAALA